MELKQIKDLMAAMGRTGTKRLKIKKDEFELELEREDQNKPIEKIVEAASTNRFQDDIEQHRVKISPSRNEKKSDTQTISDKEVDGKIVTSPMVGTFYLSAAPGEKPFVKVGDNVTEETVICIIEAMKVMNEVKAGVSGKVGEILMEDSHPVEFGTKLFRIE